MAVPVVTWKLAERLDRSEAAYMASDLEVIGAGGNPFGVEIGRFGDTVAFRMGAIDDWEFNRVLGLRSESGAELDRIVEWYRERGGPCYFDLVPMLAGRGLRESLAERGFYHDSFHTALYRVPSADTPIPAAGVSVREAGEADIETFAELYMVYMDDLGLPQPLRRLGKALVETGYPRPDWRLYVAAVEGEPAAFGMLHLGGGVASLAGAATMPSFRRRGCQTALLYRRLADARRAGCGLAVTQAAPGSVSQRNMERAGFRVAYTKAVWSNVRGG